MSGRSRETSGPDVLVIGGGPSGLAAALYLARFRRRVTVVDDGASRAARIPCSHNYPGFPDGVAGSALVAAVREQAAHHGVRFEAGRVESLQCEPGGFRARWPAGDVHAQKVVLATGVSDVPPAMAHLAQALQEGALRYCPVCDGYEVIGRSVGLVVDSGDIGEAMYLRHFSDRLSVFITSPDVRFSDADRSRLDQAGVTIVDTPIDSIRHWEGRVTVRHGDAETTVDSLYGALGIRVHSELALSLGAEHDDRGYLLTDRHLQTSVPGLYAAGDVVQGLNQIAVGVGEAAIAASHIQLELLGRA